MTINDRIDINPKGSICFFYLTDIEIKNLKKVFGESRADRIEVHQNGY